MLQISTQGGATPNIGHLTLVPSNISAEFLRCAVVPWIATYRDLDASGGSAPNYRTNPAVRSSTTCFMRGLSERINIESATGTPWVWRRICFTMKGPAIIRNNDGSYSTLATESTLGWSRLARNLTAATTTSASDYETARRIYDLVFQGVMNADWRDPITAKLDNTTISPKYDRTTRLASNGSGGFSMYRKLWHPMNKNLVYGDSESGDQFIESNMSTNGKPGMGDYYVVDLFKPLIGATNQSIDITYGATLYWHER